MVIVISSFAVIFMLIVSGGLLLFYRQAAVQRVSSVVTQSDSRSSLLSGIERTKFSASDAVSFLGRAMPTSPTETSVIQQRLVRAGYRSSTAIMLFRGSKILVPLILVTLAVVTGFANSSPFFAYAAAIGIGFLIPDFWLGRVIKKRQLQI